MDLLHFATRILENNNSLGRYRLEDAGPRGLLAVLLSTLTNGMAPRVRARSENLTIAYFSPEIRHVVRRGPGMSA
jgi:hypothetical protein